MLNRALAGAPHLPQADKLRPKATVGLTSFDHCDGIDGLDGIDGYGLFVFGGVRVVGRTGVSWVGRGAF